MKRLVNKNAFLQHLPAIGFANRLTIALMLSSLVVSGCSGNKTSSTDEKASAQNTESNIAETVPETLLEKTWVFKAIDTTWRGRFEGDVGWSNYFNRKYPDALAGASGIAQARLHTEYAVIYRQSALMHAYSTVQVYDNWRQEEDGNDSLYLRGIGNIIIGNFTQGQSDLDSLENANLKTWSQQWFNVAQNSGFSDQTPLVGHFVNLPEVNAAMTFPSENLPHFSIKTTVEGELSDVTDATELWVRSKWHEAVAKSLVDNPAVIDIALAPWLLPMEKSSMDSVVMSAVDSGVVMSDEWLFLSRYFVSEDLLFLAELKSSQTPALQVLKKWSDKSVLAQILTNCIENEQLDVQKVLNAAGQTELTLLDMMKKKDGEAQPLHAFFADFAEQAVLGAGILFAEENEQRQDSGRLRMNAKDMAQQNSKDAILLLEFAAWDASNGYPTRAQDTIHNYEADFPALRVAAIPLGMLQIRVGKGSGPNAAN